MSAQQFLIRTGSCSLDHVNLDVNTYNHIELFMINLIYQMERKKKLVWNHWTVINVKKDKKEKHPRAQCNYCHKEFERAIPERMQKHLNKCSDAPDNAKSPEIR
ncbi:6366_t:CDS:1, partial [Racocetra fulgida]